MAKSMYGRPTEIAMGVATVASIACLMLLVHNRPVWWLIATAAVWVAWFAIAWYDDTHLRHDMPFYPAHRRSRP